MSLSRSFGDGRWVRNFRRTKEHLGDVNRRWMIARAKRHPNRLRWRLLAAMLAIAPTFGFSATQPVANDRPAAAEASRMEGLIFDDGMPFGQSWFPWLLSALAVGGASLALVGFVNLKLRRKVAQNLRDLRVSEDRWHLAVQGINDGIWDVNLTNDEIFLSDRCLEMLGFEPGELKPTRAEWLARIHPDDEPARATAMEEHLQSRSGHYRAEFRMRCKDGSYRWVLSRARVVLDDQGKANRIVGSHSDIHAQKVAEEALRRNEQQYRMLFESNPNPVYVYESETLQFVAVNEAAVRHYGYSREEFLAMRLTDIRPAEDAPALLAAIDSSRGTTESGARNHGVWRHRLRDGQIIYAEVTGRVLEGTDPRCFITFVRDVTEERRSQMALRASEERYRYLFENSPVAIVECDFSRVVAWLASLRSAGVTDFGKFVADHPEALEQGHRQMIVKGVNEEMVRMLRGSSRAQVAEQFDEAATVETREACRAICRALWNGEREVNGELSMLAFDGTVVRALFRWWLPAVSGKPDAVTSQIVLLDVTDMKRAEFALAAERERLRVTLASMHEGVVTMDSDGTVQFINDGAAEMTGWSPEMAVGRSIVEICGMRHEHTRVPVALPFMEVFSSGTGFSVPPETSLMHRDGGLRLVDGRCAPINGIGGEVVGAVLVFRDVTERSRLEAQLMRSSKLESVGVLAGGIAHDFNNILTVIMGNLALTLLDEQVRGKAGRYLREAERGALRARDLTQQLLTFAKGGEPVRTSVELPELVQEAAQFALHGSKVRCEFRFAPDCWPADADPGQIGQVVQNLVINAVQAMPEGGTIRISIRNDVVDKGARPPFGGGDALKVTIADSGSGIRPEHIDRIFDPYFSTKQQGSGLGLATVYSIIRRHRGHIEVESTLGVGTTFHLWLPKARVAPEKPGAGSSPPLPIKGRVLFMDDEESIRAMAGALLRQLGLDPTVVADGADAVVEYRKARDEDRAYDAVIMDLTVPGGMGGKQALDALLEIDPGVRVIVSSGYSSDPIMSDYRAHGFRGCVAKPYRINDLAKEIWRLMGESDAGDGRVVKRR